MSASTAKELGNLWAVEQYQQSLERKGDNDEPDAPLLLERELALEE